MMLFERLLFVKFLHGVLGRFWSMLYSFCPSYGFTLRVLHKGVFKEANAPKQLHWHFPFLWWLFPLDGMVCFG